MVPVSFRVDLLGMSFVRVVLVFGRLEWSGASMVWNLQAARFVLRFADVLCS
jgi:hypothetical protein